MANSSNPRLSSFLGWVGFVWAALKLKETHEYTQVVVDEESSFVGAPRAYADNEEVIGLLDPENQSGHGRPKRVRKPGCCMCCGINCSLFWKALGIVLLVTGIWNGVKLIIWAISPSPTGLEDMPVYSTSLGCLSAPHIYKGGKTTISVPVGSRSDHAFDVHGGSPGTVFVTAGSPSSTHVEYDILIKSSETALLEQISLMYPEEAEVANSRLLMTTPLSSEGRCLRFDIVIRIPPTLKKLHVASHTAAHVQFDPGAKFSMDDLYVTLYSIRENMILPHANVHASRLSLEVYRGWIVGDVAIVNSTSILTQRGNGVANVRVRPVPNEDGVPALLQTTTGAGRTDVYYISDLAYPHRPIQSEHMSSLNGNVYLTYGQSDFSGKIELNSRSFTATGVRTFSDTDNQDPQWTHWKGNPEGKDTISIKSRGWTGLYF